MLSPTHNSAVVEWLFKNSRYPLSASKLWFSLFVYMGEEDDTGEVLLSASDWAASEGIEPDQVPAILDELVSINALLREQEEGHTRFFMNPWVATYIPDPTVQWAAREHAGALLIRIDN